MEVIPLRDYVILESVDVTQSAGGIIIPETADMEPSKRGKIVRLPRITWATYSTEDYKEGDEVLFRPHMFESIEVSGKKFLFGKQEYIIAVIKND